MKSITRSMKLNTPEHTRSKKREECLRRASKHKQREIEETTNFIEIFVLVDNKTYIEFGKVRYRNNLVSLDDI